MIRKILIGRSLLSVAVILLVTGISVVAGIARPQDANTQPSPVALTAEQDHQRIMELLKISKAPTGERIHEVQIPQGCQTMTSRRRIHMPVS